MLSWHSLRSGLSQMMQCDRQEVQCRAGARNLGSYVLDSVLHRSIVRTHGFVLMDGDSLQYLGRCNNALSDRMGRASLSPAISAARLCDFSSHVVELVAILHHG